MEQLTGASFLEMLESGCNNLNNLQQDINALNVFPVPDGDTGTNMSLTYTNGMSEASKSGSASLPVIAKTFSRGLLMGARGNSGVILSQIFRGFSQAVQGISELDSEALSNAMLNGSKMAYKAVMRPVEGTILTVIRESAEKAEEYRTANPGCTIEKYTETLYREAQASLAHTPELLPVLKEARVVDSGGSGLVAVFEGFVAYLRGKPVKPVGEEQKESATVTKAEYCTELIARMSERGSQMFDEEKLRKTLGKIGSEITLINDGDLLKVRVYTNTPGDVLNILQRYGSLINIQIDNVSVGLRESILDSRPEEKEAEEEKEFGIITVAAGDGLKQLFTEYRADVVVSGGQTMNPSTEDFVSAIKKVNARHIYIMPNNSNIIMAARQAAQVSEGRDVIVLETTSIPQGLSACIAFNPEEDAESNTENMTDAISQIKTGQITYAIKNTVVDGREIHEGDFMGLFNKDIVLTDPDKVGAACRLLQEMCDEDTEIVTIIRGEDASEEEAAAVSAFLEEHYEVDIDMQNGGQPVYSFIFGVE